jgi:hypothetical protein
MLCGVAPGRFSSERFNEYVPEKEPVVVVSIDRPYVCDDPEGTFRNGESVVENTPGTLAEETLSRSNFAVQLAPKVPGRLKIEKFWLAVPVPCVSVPKSISSVVRVLVALKDPMAWSRTLMVTGWLNVGEAVWGLVASTETVPVAKPA